MAAIQEAIGKRLSAQELATLCNTNVPISYLKASTGVAGLITPHISTILRLGYGRDMTTGSFGSIIGQLEAAPARQHAPGALLIVVLGQLLEAERELGRPGPQLGIRTVGDHQVLDVAVALHHHRGCAALEQQLVAAPGRRDHRDHHGRGTTNSVSTMRAGPPGKR